VAGTWKGLSDNVNSMARNLTAQVRNISEAATVIASGRRELIRMNAALKGSNEELALANERLRTERSPELQNLTRTLEEANAHLGESNARLEDANARLEDANTRFENANAQLEAANASLSESATRKDEFLAMLAHELRNPLNPIRNVLEVMRLDASPENLEWGRGLIDKQVRHLTRLIDDLLDVNRITRDRLLLVRGPINLRDALKTAVETTIDLEQKYRFTSAIPEEPILVHGDLVRLTQIFANILHNATKFTPVGGTIHLGVLRPEAMTASAHCRVSIRDGGLGIPPGELSRLFDLFYQANATRGQANGGLGIGLTLVRRLVELHGGTVEAFSDGVGKGSEFVVGLPMLWDGASAPEGNEVDKAIGPTEGRRVLVVDDNPDSVETLCRLLELRGNHVATATSGEEALELARSFNPEVVLMDIGMPGVSGHEVARRIRAESWGRAMTLIALTGWGTDRDRQLSREAGFDHHLVKPFNIDDLDLILVQDGLRQGPRAPVTPQ